MLYHYTTQKGLLGIVETGEIWATNIFYLNDATEYEYAFKMLKDKINEKIEKLEPSPKGIASLIPALNDIEKQFYYKLIYTLDDLKASNPFYICSFSENKDQLSQWRGYCPKGNGFSIGFNKSLLMKQYGFKLQKCIYGKNKNYGTVEDLINNSINFLKKPDDEGVAISVIIDDTVVKAIELFYSIAPTIKHKTFKEELEWRLTKKNFL